MEKSQNVETKSAFTPFFFFVVEKNQKFIIGVNALLVPTFWPYFYFDPYIFFYHF